MLNFNTDNLGEFQERERGRWFTYRATSNSWALSHGLTHEVDVLDGVRFAIVKRPALVCAWARVTQASHYWKAGRLNATAFITDRSAHKFRFWGL